MLSLQPSSFYADPTHPLSISLHGQGEPPLLPSTVRAYVPLFYALLLRQGVPLCHPSADPAHLPQVSAYLLQ